MNVRSTLQPLKINGPKIECSSNSVRVLAEPLLVFSAVGSAMDDLEDPPSGTGGSLGAANDCCTASQSLFAFMCTVTISRHSIWCSALFPGLSSAQSCFSAIKKIWYLAISQKETNIVVSLDFSFKLDASTKPHAIPCSYTSILSFLVISFLVRIIPICCRWSRIVAVQMKYVGLWYSLSLWSLSYLLLQAWALKFLVMLSANPRGGSWWCWFLLSPFWHAGYAFSRLFLFFFVGSFTFECVWHCPQLASYSSVNSSLALTL